MNVTKTIVAAGVMLAALSGAAKADALLGSYVARLSHKDHQASDGYQLDSAAQVIRQDRANWHKFGRGDRQDQDDPWFDTNESRDRLQRMLERPGVLDGGMKREILNGTPLIQVDVYTHSVAVSILED
jgi:hypothetical protein